ncbi:unnamed protein product [Symbiodinium natans]|uniref:Uncharacterized protein n=1 Tax=Symbiodinium natans TaxID=878477 RepID=A0A812RA22_9DINO|nr:unnamed protein product [Symbiodinium natans]
MRAILVAMFALLTVGSFADESMKALAADDESATLNLLQKKGALQTEDENVEEMMDAEVALEMSTPGLYACSALHRLHCTGRMKGPQLETN